jgi:glucose-6-phosphate isomerase
MSINTTPAWQALVAHAAQLKPRHLRELFSADPQRVAGLSMQIGDLLFDFSKQRVNRETIRLLSNLAEAADLTDCIDRMFSGEPINASEGRAALHSALRQPDNTPVLINGENVMPGVRAMREKMRFFCEEVRAGHWRGYAGEPIRTVVNLGIGGSDLGPRMATTALSAFSHPALGVHYVSNLDGADIAPVLEVLDPRTTMFVVASKTFVTIETLTNARTARDWLLTHAGEAGDTAMARQIVAVTANPAAALQFGIHPDHIFEFWDWVGGRFSLWSAVGLPLALAIGMDNFEQLLKGAHDLDEHFRTAPPEKNLPMLMALLGIWNINFLGAGNLSISPYSQSLHFLPQYLQQLEMESNGKNVSQDGKTIAYATAPIIWGDAGSNTQHAYFQLLHQGGRLIPSDFHAFAESDYPLPGHHERLLANCFAQAEALAFGNPDEVSPLKRCLGNQPSSTFVMPRLDPYHLGLLIAAYEHKTFVQGMVWGINPFDQWGVELGKKLALRLLPAVEGGPLPDGCDASTAGLIAHCRTLRNKHL